MRKACLTATTGFEAFKLVRIRLQPSLCPKIYTDGAERVEEVRVSGASGYVERLYALKVEVVLSGT